MNLIRSSLMTCALLTTFSTASAQTGPAPTDDLSAMMGVAVHAAQEVADAQTQRAQFESDARVFLPIAAFHNANRCNVQLDANGNGDYSVCDAYEAEKRTLEARRLILVTRERDTAHRLVTARSNFGMAMARIRIMAITSELEAWRQGVLICNTLDSGAAARGCLQSAWDNVPRRLVRRTGN